MTIKSALFFLALGAFIGAIGCGSEVATVDMPVDDVPPVVTTPPADPVVTPPADPMVPPVVTPPADVPPVVTPPADTFAACAFAQAWNINGTGKVVDAIATSTVTACVSAAATYKRTHTSVPICQGVISGQTSTFEGFDPASSYPVAGVCTYEVDTSITILTSAGPCEVIVTTTVSSDAPVKGAFNTAPVCTI